MSVNKLGILLFSSFLMFATAPLAPAQQTNQDTTKKQTTTTEKSTATKDTSKTTKTTDKTANPDNQSTAGQSASGLRSLRATMAPRCARNRALAIPLRAAPMTKTFLPAISTRK